MTENKPVLFTETYAIFKRQSFLPKYCRMEAGQTIRNGTNENNMLHNLQEQLSSASICTKGTSEISYVHRFGHGTNFYNRVS